MEIKGMDPSEIVPNENRTLKPSYGQLDLFGPLPFLCYLI